jgi:FMN reductase
MARMSIVGLSGGLSERSRTSAIVGTVADRVAARAGGQSRLIEVATLEGIGDLRSRAKATDAVRDALDAVEAADLIVVGSPVYKGAYTGLFKHFVDFLAPDALVGVPVALLATGGSDRHALVVEHALRPLFAFFQAQPLGTAVFVTDREIVDGVLTSELAERRVDRLVEEAVQALDQRARHAIRQAAE